MIASTNFIPMSPQEYLKWEEQQPIKYEYVNGEVLAMTGGTLPHNSVALNLASALKNHLRGKGCKVFMADAKLGISDKGPYHYPDVMVTCDQRDLTSRKIVQFPCLIVEVLSPGTEAFDRGDKFKHYRRIKTLKEYVLIDAEKTCVECYRLNERGKWELTSYSIDDTFDETIKLINTEVDELEFSLTSLDFNFPISLLYEDVAFDVK
ncbi:MAG: Uma2 family endonuclease [Nostocaceae cyanobacterium]|nr:Uma2 family endonuclease [Nostocaceae cyanobacterium]